MFLLGSGLGTGAATMLPTLCFSTSAAGSWAAGSLVHNVTVSKPIIWSHLISSAWPLLLLAVVVATLLLLLVVVVVVVATLLLVATVATSSDRASFLNFLCR